MSWREWRDALRDLVGRPPKPSEPLVPRKSFQPLHASQPEGKPQPAWPSKRERQPMTPQLSAAVAFVLAKETGELTDRPDDPGGLTCWGVALNRHPELTADDIRNMTAARAGQIFADSYWPARADELPYYLATPLLACSVLQGKETAVEILQAALGASIDGAIGPQTLSAARMANAKTLLARFLGEQVRHFQKAPAWPVDGVGWCERSAAAILESTTL
jgi:lysozyme family protein